MDEIHYFQEPIRRQFRFATERQSDSSRVLAEGSAGCKHERSRSGGDAVVVIPASGSDDRCRSYVKCLTLFAVIWASVRTVRGPG